LQLDSSIIISVLLGLGSGFLAGLLPSITPSVAFILFLPFVPNDPFAIVCYAMVICVGSQFFGSQAIFYYKLPGETSSVPLLLEMHSLNDPHKIRNAIEITTIGSLVASFIGITVLWLALSWGWFNDLRLPLIGRSLIYVVLTLVVIFSPINRWPQNILALCILVFFANYAEISMNVIPELPIYFFSNFLAVLILLSTQMIWQVLSNPVKTQNSAPESGYRTYWQVLKKYKFLYARYGLLGSILGILPYAGATMSSYISYIIEKRFNQSTESRIAASETANNSAVIIMWMPLLILGVPITPIEILLAQHFAYYQFDITSIKNNIDMINVLSIILLISALFYTLLALKTNQVFYKILSQVVFKWQFALLMVFICILSYVWIQQIGIIMLAVHLIIFVPLSYLLYKLQVGLFTVVIGLIMSSEIYFSWQQFYQIYF
jgi:putative tricarboxylic transport membrane protein